ncbi:MAG: hypothetical protein ACHQ6T_02125 [Myxococcota bacterium]
MNATDRTRERMESGKAPAEAPAANTGWRVIPPPGGPDREGDSLAAQRRADERTPLSLRVQRSSIDAVRDSVTGELFYDVADDDVTTNLSRRGLCIRCERPPEIGTRVLVQLRFEDEAPVDVVGLARWSKVAFVPGQHGARAVALVGLELLGGAPRALERYGRALGKLSRSAASADAATQDSAVASSWDRR